MPLQELEKALRDLPNENAPRAGRIPCNFFFKLSKTFMTLAFGGDLGSK